MKHVLQKILGVIVLLLAWIVYALTNAGPSGPASVMSDVNSGLQSAIVDDDYRTTYEVFVYSFADSDSDGIGDLKGLTDRLDYISDLGFNQIWLMPVCPSPTYHKYDVTDYVNIDPQYGTMEDYDRLISECHQRGIRVIIDLVLNHTSSQHPWFTEAVNYIRTLPVGSQIDAAECPYAEYYNFTGNGGSGFASVQGTGWYYEARFWDGMPDLNLDNQAVRDEIDQIIGFWSEHGTDGFRLDAVTSYYTGNPDKNIGFLKWVNDTANKYNPDSYIVCEGWENQDSYARYYASGVDSMFDFAFADASGMIAKTLLGNCSARDYGNALEREWQLFQSYQQTAVNAPFYTNHDMGRGAGYYAGDDGRKTKTALAMNLFTTGNAFIYYGEELGMKGSGKDENKRAPMYWSTDAAYAGMTSGPPYMDAFEMKFPSYEEQKDDPYSIYNYVKQAMKIRNAFPVIARGRTWVHQDLTTDQVCILLKEDDEHAPCAIVMNLSDAEQTVNMSNTEFHQLKAVLTVNDTAVSYGNNTLVLPPYGIAVLTE